MKIEKSGNANGVIRRRKSKGRQSNAQNKNKDKMQAMGLKTLHKKQNLSTQIQLKAEVHAVPAPLVASVVPNI